MSSTIPGGTPASADIRISAPARGVKETVTCTPGSRLQCAFDLEQAGFARSGNDLSISMDGGGTVVLSGFFAVGDQPLPTFVLNDGTQTAAADMLRSFDAAFDLSTAAGPASSAPASSGVGEYAGDSGDLLAGLDRLGSLGTDQWGRAGETPELVRGVLDLGGSGGVSPAGSEQLPPDAGGNALSIRCTSVTVDEAHLAAGTAPDASALSKTGTVVLNGHGEPVVLTITDAAGVDHQVSFNPDGTLRSFDGVAFDPAHPPVIAAPHGELTLTGAGMSASGDITVSYSYTLGNNADHAVPGAWGADDTLVETLRLTVTDAGGDTAEVDLSITILDDHPETGDAAKGIDQHGIGNQGSTETGTIPDFAFGADGPAEADSLVFTAPTGLTSQGGVITYTDDGHGTISGWTGPTLVFTLSVDPSNGSYTYTQYRLIDNAPANGIPFSFVMADGDNDTATGSVTITPTGTYEDRFVMYTGARETDINGKAITGNVTFNDPDGNAATPLSVTDGVYGRAVINPATGEVTYTLLPDAYSRMAGETNALIRDYVEYTARDATGKEYTKTIEIVIDRRVSGAGLFISPNEIDGETHQNYITTQGDGASGTQEIQGSDGRDVFKAGMDIVGAEINLGAGSDVFMTVGANGANGAKSGTVLSRSTLDMGAGDDLVDIASTDSPAVVDSMIVAGAGADTVRIGGNVSASTIALGDNLAGVDTGDTLKNVLTVDGSVVGSKVYGTAGADSIMVSVATGNAVDASTILTGAGDDTIAISGGAWGVFSGNLDAGDGDNTVTVSGTSGGSLSGSSVITGTGNDRIILNGNVAGASSVAAGLGSDTVLINGNVRSGSTIALGALTTGVDTADTADNFLTVNGQVASSTVYGTAGKDVIEIRNATASGVNDSRLYTGDGDDSVFISSTASSALLNGLLDAGEGNNTITLSGVYGANNSIIHSGAGDDSISLTGSVGGSSYGLYKGSLIDTGGNNTVVIGGATHGVNSAEVSLGAGDDTVSLSGTAGNGIYGGSFTDTGGENVITIYGALAGINASQVTTGAGNDRITVGSGGAGSGLLDGGLDAGDGNNTISLSGLYGSNNSSIQAGIGDDVITLTGSGASGYGMLHSSLTDTGGDNTITITGTDWGLGNSTVTTGAGDDVVDISGGLFSLVDSHVDLGAGNDTLRISGRVGSSSTLDGGDGYDILSLDITGMADLAAFKNAYNFIFNSTYTGWSDHVVNFEHLQLFGAADLPADIAAFLAGTGIDHTLAREVDLDSMTFTQAEHSDYSLHGTNPGADIDLGRHRSDDTVSLQSLSGHSVNLGDGSDHLTIAGHAVDASILGTGTDAEADAKHLGIGGLEQSSLALGGGNDHVFLGTGGSDPVLAHSSVDLGAGDDTLIIDQGGCVADPSDTDSSINLGAGSDLILFRSSTGTGLILDANGQGVVVDGGTGGEIIAHAAADGGLSKVGDIIGFADNPAHQVSRLQGHTVKGFEALLVDYGTQSGGLLDSGDSVSLDDLLQVVHSLNRDGENAVGTLIIKGDGNDTVGGLTDQTPVHTNVTVDGVDGTFTLYTVHDGAQDLQVYVQNLVTFG